MMLVRCPKCHGSGLVLRRGGSVSCSRCSGTGRLALMERDSIEPPDRFLAWCVVMLAAVLVVVLLLHSR